MTKKEFLAASLATVMTVLPVAVKADDTTPSNETKQEEQRGFEVRPLKYKGKVLQTEKKADLCITADDLNDAGFLDNPTTLVSVSSFECGKGNIRVMAAMKEASGLEKFAAVLGTAKETAVAVSNITAEQKEANASKKMAKAAADGAFKDQVNMTNSQQQSQNQSQGQQMTDAPINVEGAQATVGNVSGGSSINDNTLVNKPNTEINSTNIVKPEINSTNIVKPEINNTNVVKPEIKVQGGSNNGGGHNGCNGKCPEDRRQTNAIDLKRTSTLLSKMMGSKANVTMAPV